MSANLNIFLSYKMPKEDDQLDIAKEFAGELSDLAGGRIKTHYAGAYAPNRCKSCRSPVGVSQSHRLAS